VLDLHEPDRADFVDLNRTRLRIWEWGDLAAPPVVCVHGGWDHGRMWDGFAPRVAALGHHVVALDQRGHGDSGRLHSGTSWLTWNLDLALLARHLGAPVGLIGHSMGGGQALSVAAAFPELVSWVVNIDGLGPPPEMMRVVDHAAHAAQWLGDAERIWWEPQREYDSIAEMAERRKAINTRLPYEWCEHLARYGSVRAPGGRLVWKSDQIMRLGSPQPFGEPHLLAQYGQIGCPVLVLTGSEPDQWSFLAPADRARRLHAIARHEHHVVEGAGHYVHIEQPVAALDHLRAFLAHVVDG
jgi:pimeloyl-ACP methyl ester carboxylesterase